MALIIVVVTFLNSEESLYILNNNVSETIKATPEQKKFWAMNKLIIYVSSALLYISLTVSDWLTKHGIFNIFVKHIYSGYSGKATFDNTQKVPLFELTISNGTFRLLVLTIVGILFFFIMILYRTKLNKNYKTIERKKLR